MGLCLVLSCDPRSERKRLFLLNQVDIPGCFTVLLSCYLFHFSIVQCLSDQINLGETAKCHEVVSFPVSGAAPLAPVVLHPSQ